MEENKEYLIPTSKDEDHIFSNIDLTFGRQSNEFDIKIIGVGTAGCNIVDYLAQTNKSINEWATLYAFDTDIVSLRNTKHIKNLFLLNKDELKGYGSGSNQDVARKALLHDSEVISRELVGTSLLFIIAGLGKGTGSGAAPELAKIAKDLGIITISIANLPSISSEGNQIYNQAFNSLQTLSTNSDCVSTISNDKILNVNPGISFYDIYHTANQKIVNIIQDIVKIIFAPGQINITLADLKTFFSTNQYFIGDRVELNMTDLSQTKIEQTLAKQIDNSLTDIKTVGCKQAIINILLSKQAPPNIVNDIRIGFAKATKNDKIVLGVGVEYNDENKIKISYLLSGGNLESGFEQITTINTEPTIKFEPVVDQSIEEYDQLMKQVTTASKSTQEILKENDQEIKIREN